LCVAGSRSQNKAADNLHVKTAKFPHSKFSTQRGSNARSVLGDRKEVAPACEQLWEKNSSVLGKQTAGSTTSTVEEMHIVCKEHEVSVSEHAPSANVSKNDCQATCTLKLGKETEDSPFESTHEQNKSVATLDQNFDRQLSKKFSTEKKDVDKLAVLHRAAKDSKKPGTLTPEVSPQTKTSRARTHQSHLHRHRRSSLDENSSRPHHHRRHRHHSHHHHDKPGTEQTSRNGEQLVPPLKIRVEHHRKSSDHQSAVAMYLVDSCGSENVRNDIKKSSDAKLSVEVPAAEPAAHVNDNKTEKDVLPLARDTVSKEGDKPTTLDQRRTRSSSAMRPMPLVKKRRLTFEESLIAGTCISTTSGSAITTDSVKMSAIASALSETANHNKQECPSSSAKLTADAKATSVLEMLEKKELISSDTKRIKLDDEISASVQHFSGARKLSDEVKQRSSNTVNVDSDYVKSLSHPVPVQRESKSNPAESQSAAHYENKCESKHNQGFNDSNTKCMNSNDSHLAENEFGMKNNLTDAGLAAVAKEPPNYSVKNPSSHSTSRHHQHHNHHGHHLRHSGSGTKPHRMSGNQLDYELKRSRHSGSKYGSLIHIETHPNGGASVVHAFDDELSTLSPREFSEFVREFFHVVFDEEPVGVPRYVIGIVHNSAAYLPDILEYFASVQPDMVVKRGHLGKSSDVETTTIGEYFHRVRSTYLAGTYRTGPLDHFSIVGTKAEETGGYFPQFLDLLDQNEFLKYVSPWGKISELENIPRNESNDGPIVWARPGEQVVPTADMPKSPMVKKR